MDDDNYQAPESDPKENSREVVVQEYDPQAPEWRAAHEKSREILDPDYARIKYRDALVDGGIPKEQADRIAETSGIPDDPATAKAREELRDSYMECGMTREEANRIAGRTSS